MTCGDKFNQNCPTGGTRVEPAEADGRPRCDHPGCGKRLQGDGTCVDGHGQGGPQATAPGQTAEAGDDITALRVDLLRRHPGLDLWLKVSSSGHLVVDRIVVPPAQRGQGRGTAVMQELIAVADARGVPMALTPDRSFGGSVTRLREFYRRFGFVPNTGRTKDFTTRESMVRPTPTRPVPPPPTGGTAEAEARCAYPGCGKKITAQGRCCDGHDQATAHLAPAPVPLPECRVPERDKQKPVPEVAGVYAPLVAVAREHGFFISTMLSGTLGHIALALNDRSGGYWSTYLLFNPTTKRLYAAGWDVRTQWKRARRALGDALRNTAADKKAAGRALIAAVEQFHEAAGWPYEELVALPGGELRWPAPRPNTDAAAEPTPAAVGGVSAEGRGDNSGAERGEPDARCAVCGTAIYPDEGRGQCIICGAPMCGHCTISGARCRDCDTEGWYDA